MPAAFAACSMVGSTRRDAIARSNRRVCLLPGLVMRGHPRSRHHAEDSGLGVLGQRRHAPSPRLARTKPDTIVDLATLTEAARIALGSLVARVMGNDQAVGLLAASGAAGEPL